LGKDTYIKKELKMSKQWWEPVKDPFTFDDINVVTVENSWKSKEDIENRVLQTLDYKLYLEGRKKRLILLLTIRGKTTVRRDRHRGMLNSIAPDKKFFKYFLKNKL
jgi:hypothetical protein